MLCFIVLRPSLHAPHRSSAVLSGEQDPAVAQAVATELLPFHDRGDWDGALKVSRGVCSPISRRFDSIVACAPTIAACMTNDERPFSAACPDLGSGESDSGGVDGEKRLVSPVPLARGMFTTLIENPRLLNANPARACFFIFALCMDVSVCVLESLLLAALVR